MINLAVINLKTIIRKVTKLIIFVFLFAIVIKLGMMIYTFFKNFDLQEFGLNSNICMIKNNLSITKSFEEEIVEEKDSELKKILVAELAVFSGAEKRMSEEKKEDLVPEILDNEIADVEEISVEENSQEVLDEEKADIEEVQENTEIVQTSVIEANNKKDVYTDIYKSVQIKNESKYSLTEAMVTPNAKYTNNKDIIIYHTHTCESYSPTESSNYEMTGNFRTTDLNYSVARVGDELTNCLAGKGYTVIHDKNYHDYPAFTGSYNRSLATVTNLLKTYNTVDCVFDIHRDALGNQGTYAPCVKIGDETVAQLMFVIGTDGGGLEHPNWNNNLKLAIKIQEKANEIYPGLFKPIVLRDSRYNQHVTGGAAIIEVGATGNTLEQATGSMKYLANIIDLVMKE